MKRYQIFEDGKLVADVVAEDAQDWNIKKSFLICTTTIDFNKATIKETEA